MSASLCNPAQTNNLFHTFDDVHQDVQLNEEIAFNISKIISSHGLSNALGGLLLHKHFDLNEGEALVLSRMKDVDDERNILMKMEPRKIATCSEDYHTLNYDT